MYPNDNNVCDTKISSLIDIDFKDANNFLVLSPLLPVDRSSGSLPCQDHDFNRTEGLQAIFIKLLVCKEMTFQNTTPLVILNYFARKTFFWPLERSFTSSILNLFPTNSLKCPLWKSNFWFQSIVLWSQTLTFWPQFLTSYNVMAANFWILSPEGCKVKTSENVRDKEKLFESASKKTTKNWNLLWYVGPNVISTKLVGAVG